MKEEFREKRCICIFAAGLLVALTILAGRLAFFHLANFSRLKYGDYSQTSMGIRGRIFDGSANPVQMAVSLPYWEFIADRNGFLEWHKKKERREKVLVQVSEVLGIPYEVVSTNFSAGVPWGRTLGISADPAVFDALVRNSKNVSGVKAKEIALRNYPQGRRMSHVLGFLDWQSIGVAGIEQRHELHLKGTEGLTLGKQDGSNKADAGERRIPEMDYVSVSPIPGHDIYLTLDNNIQYYVETALKEAVERVNAAGAWAIVQDVHTGAILAMASYPDFDPQDRSAVPKEVWRNNAITTMYEPGSIMKTISLAAALNERLVTANTVMDVGYGDFFYARTSLKNNASGRITVARGFKISNNVIFAKLGLELGARRLEAYMRAAGFDEKLEIELPGEAKGMLDWGKRPWNRWDKVKPTRVPIGQGVSVTALQMINAYSMIANGGTLLRPYVVKQVLSSNGETIHQGERKEIGNPIRPEVAQVMRELMIDVTEDGTGTRARVPGYTVAGKTGTAQHAVRGGYSSTEFYASFVGFVPARDPVFSVLVTVDRPAPGFARTGGAVAAPAFASIATATARYLEVPPDLPSGQDAEVRSAGVNRR